MTLPILAIATDDAILCPGCEKKADPAGTRYPMTVFETADCYSPDGHIACGECGARLFSCKRPGEKTRAMRVRGRS